jgi:hypothetical protein
MKIEVQCTTCKTPHYDHDECSNCGHRITNFICVYPSKETEEEMNKRAEKELWKYCPWCGERL